MTTNQTRNIFYYLGVMLIDNKIINTSPDYLIEKSISFFGKLGKDEFISDIKNCYSTQRLDKKYDVLGFWYAYCKTWNVKQDNYEVMNIVNFILNSNINVTTNVIKNFKKNIGDVETIPDYDLSYKVHPNLIEHINKNVDFNSRYLKLISLNNINKNKK